MAYSVKVMNNISNAGLIIFDDSYVIGKDVENPDVILVRSARVETDLYLNLTVVARAGAGVDKITVKEATDKGICVFNTPGANANAVSELVFIMLGICARNIHKALSFTQSLAPKASRIDVKKIIEGEKSRFKGFELLGKTLGVIGLGKIGVRVANGGIERGMNVVGYDTSPAITNIHELDSKVEIVARMDEVLDKADILTVHVPLSEKTKYLIGESEINKMKSGGILVNFARDGIYNDNAVITAIKESKVNTYITDFPTPALLQENNVLCTPHLGASTAESEENCAIMAVRQVMDYLKYGVVVHSVNFPKVDVFPGQSTVTRLAIVNRDVPKMIAAISSVLGEADINIQALTNGGNGTIGYNLVDLDVNVPDQVVTIIKRLDNILRVRVIKLSK
ncbi:3-phosphoglycerate dehydrogenase family protein [Patescibacteria group bacterium]